MPETWDQYRAANASAALLIESRDPELVSLLKGATLLSGLTLFLMLCLQSSIGPGES